MSYHAIFEIGPINKTLEASRKLRDYAGGSFLFSYLMGKMANEIYGLETDAASISAAPDVNEIIKEPFLKNDPLFMKLAAIASASGKVQTGTIPDRIYCNLKNDKIINMVKEKFQQHLLALFNKVLENGEISNEQRKLAEYQLNTFFRFFYVWSKDQQLSGHKLDPAAITRGGIYDFPDCDDEKNSVSGKHEKCSLCGDRKKIITLKKALRGAKDEHLCAVCLLKRRFIYKMPELIGATKYPSTTDMAAVLAKEVLKQLSEELKSEITTFGLSHFSVNGEAKDDVREELEDHEIDSLNLAINSQNTRGIIKNSSYQLYFSEEQAAIEFRKKILARIKSKENPVDLHQRLSGFQIKENIKIEPWLKQAFYCIVVLDGDSTGDFISKLDDNKKILASEAISEYSRETVNIVTENEGVVVYSGGEDTIAVLHPLFLLRTVASLSNRFQGEIKDNVGSAPTLSAGAVICHHKHPLTLAIRDANSMLFEKAKTITGKDSLAVKVIKGSGEACYFHAKISETDKFNLNDFEQLIGIGIPRGFVYKLIEDKEVLQATLKTKDEMEGYVKFLYEKSRAGVTDEALEALQTLVNKTVNNNGEPDLKQLINRLYFARFLEGESL